MTKQDLLIVDELRLPMPLSRDSAPSCCSRSSPSVYEQVSGSTLVTSNHVRFNEARPMIFGRSERARRGRRCLDRRDASVRPQCLVAERPTADRLRHTSKRALRKDASPFPVRPAPLPDLISAFARSAATFTAPLFVDATSTVSPSSQALVTAFTTSCVFPVPGGPVTMVSGSRRNRSRADS